MKKIKYFPISFLIIFLIGCESSTGVKQRGQDPTRNYSIRIDDSYNIDTYSNGGGTFIISRGNKIAAATDVKLTVQSDIRLSAVLNNKTLTMDSWFSELSVRPDKNIGLGVYPVLLTANYNGKIDTFKLTVHICKNYDDLIEKPSESALGSAINLINKNWPYDDINKNVDWKTYFFYLDITWNYYYNFTIFQSSSCEIVYIKLPISKESWIACRRRLKDINYSFAMRSYNEGEFKVMNIADFYTMWGDLFPKR